MLACVRKGLSVRQGDLHEGLRDYPDRSFDTVILSQTLPYLNDPAFVIHEMLRVGSRAIVSFPNWGHWRCRLSLLLTGRIPMSPGLPQPWHVAPRARPLTVQRLSRFLCAEWDSDHDADLSGRFAPHPARRDKNLRATIAIFELAQGRDALFPLTPPRPHAIILN